MDNNEICINNKEWDELCHSILEFNFMDFNDGNSIEDFQKLSVKFYDIIINTKLLDVFEKKSKEQYNIENGFKKNIDLKEILNRELVNKDEHSEDRLVQNICFWSNRIAHEVENNLKSYEKTNGNGYIARFNDLYSKYYLNLDYNYDMFDIENEENNDRISSIIRDSGIFGGYSCDETIEGLNTIFKTINLREALYYCKQISIKKILLNNDEKETKLFKQLDEKKTINKNGTYRIMVKPKNVPFPMVVHIGEEIYDDFCDKNNISVPDVTEGDNKEFINHGWTSVFFRMTDQEIEEIDKKNLIYKRIFREGG